MNSLSAQRIADLQTKTHSLIGEFTSLLDVLAEADRERSSFETERAIHTGKLREIEARERTLAQDQEVLRVGQTELARSQGEVTVMKQTAVKNKESFTQAIEAWQKEKQERIAKLIEDERAYAKKKEELAGLEVKQKELEILEEQVKQDRLLVEKEKKIDRERKMRLDMREEAVKRKEEQAAQYFPDK